MGSVSTIITERLQERGLQMEEAEATLLALGVHSDTGSLTFDSATARYDGQKLEQSGRTENIYTPVPWSR